MPVDRERIHKYGAYLLKFQDQSDTPEWRQVAEAYKGLRSQMLEEDKATEEYAGLGGTVKALGQGIRNSLPEGVDLAIPNPGRLAQTTYRYLREKIDGTPYERVPSVLSAGTEALIGRSDVNVDAMPEGARSSYRAGEFIGGSAPAAALTMGAAGLGAAAGRGVATALATGGAEAAAAGGGGTAVKVTDLMGNGNETANAIAGVAGSVLSPTALAALIARTASRTPGAARVGNAIADTINPVRGASRNLGAAITDGGGDIDEIVRQLRSNPGKPGTVAADSQELHDIAAALAQKNVRFGRDFRATEDSALAGLTDDAAGTIGGTNASDLSGALRMDADALAQQAARREAEARDAAGFFRPEGDQVRRASELLNDELDSAFATRQSRGKAMYDALPLKNIAIQNTELQGFADTITELQRRARDVSSWMDDPTKELMAQVLRGNASAEDLHILRSNIERNARDTGMAGSPNRGAIQVAGVLSKKLGDILDNQGIQGWRDANKYTRETYDAFERSAVGTALRNTPQGQKIDARELGNFVTEGSTNAQMSKLADVRAALDAGERGGAMRADQWGLEPTVRQRIGERAIDPTTGMVDPGKASRVLDDEIVGQFPVSRDNLSRARSLSGQAQGVRSLAEESSKRATELGGVLDERPAAVLNSMLGGAKAVPMKSLDEVLIVARKSPKGEAGLKAALREYLMQDKDPVKIAIRMSETVSDKGGTLLDWMRANKLITTTDYANLKRIGDRVAKTGVRRAVADARATDLESRVPDFAQVLARIGGARLGAPLVPGAGAIQSAGIGSQYAKKLLNSQFGGKRQVQVLEDAFLNRNDRDLASLLERYRASAKGLGPSAGLPYPLRGVQIPGGAAVGTPDERDSRTRQSRVLGP